MYYSKSGYTNLETLMQDIATRMLTNGFTLSMVNGNVGAANIASSATSILLNAGLGVDARSQQEQWSVLLRADDAAGWMSINVIATATLVGDIPPVTKVGSSTTGTGTTSSTTDTYIESGRISNGADTSKYFIHRTDGWKLDSNDGKAHPISFYLHIGDHGFALGCWSENTTISGTDFSWVVAQRGVQQSNLSLPSYKSPVICVYQTETSGDANALDASCIQRFTVIEDDVASSTQPVSAVVCASDVVPIINPLQQVSITADNAVMILYPQLYNTSRHVYFLVLDLLAYCSADVISQDSTVGVSFQTGVINYHALIANGMNNTGVRILFPMV